MSVQIIQYESGYKHFFRDLNYEWLNKYFSVTAEDDKILSDPEKIIENGGCILFAIYMSEVVGTCALIKESPEAYEIAKMAVTEKAQGKKIGWHLLNAIIEEARIRGARILELDTARKLEAAIALYKKAGFVQSAGERIHPDFGRTTFRMELKLPEAASK
jgi:putative acetyltransferase